jgi:hypothetical protein
MKGLATTGTPVVATQAGAFAVAAQDLRRHGLAVLPVGGVDGKRPLVKNWSRWRWPPSEDFVTKLVRQHGGANIGIVTGLSGVTIVDIDSDDSAVLSKVIGQLGDTPLKARSPRGAPHLYYRSSGERSISFRTCRDLRADLQDLPVDVKGARRRYAPPARTLAAPTSSWPDRGMI